MSTHMEQMSGCKDMIRARLRILATTDLHMHILPYDYLSDRPVEGWGLTNTAQLIADARAEEPNTILLDNGDFLHGTAMGDLVVEQYRATGEADAPAVHPMIAAMDHLGYDAATLGNHDFDRGVEVLFDAIEQAEFPIVSANTIMRRAATPLQDATLVPPFAMLTRKIVDTTGVERDIRIGVIGFLPPGSLKLGHNSGTAPQTRDIIQTARAFVPYLKARGADIIVALAHSGLGDDTYVEGMENALLPLSQVAGIDAIVGGHSHQVFPELGTGAVGPDGLCEELNHVPTIVPGFWGSHLGVIDLDLTHDGTRWSVAAGRAALRKVTGGGETCAPPRTPKQFPNWVQELHESTLDHMRTPIARCAKDLDNFFALVGGDHATRLVQEAMIAHAKKFQADTLDWDLPILASSAPFKSGGLAGPNYYSNVPAGQVTQRCLSDLYVFPNELTLIRATGAYLRNWLERSASLFNQVRPGERSVQLKDDGTPGYLLESVLGLTYQIDLSQPARFTTDGVVSGSNGGRIVDLRHNGRPVRDQDRFLLATSNFRACGGGGYPAVPEDRVVDIPPLTIRDVLKDFVRQAGLVDVSTDPIWRFSKVAGSSIRFKSSPAACRSRANYPWLPIRCVNTCDDRGFAHYEMEL
ncbi:bifunctional 2',3'-cyclic-nucleotide 2'-phosphodiesterase/3'-nucleotidase [Aliiroseovarius sp. Z3]|uniref:bifunctional 2',3'-cyclic-nucleotide 2'-phosphodiesterase/3'-nucleotidase n=1 Tax=Aliiroseovarius sp. Z3 TaxID=2811402 RepID=UPI0023B2163A|nr:bifunctional 2',3'-cyclic-nucleotide 2'-phosphodiesterase/3'-nucleotidase [Aliiroseovarius sp. Z3]MDE9449539.1 bifunctional 2',3'-cyclic-nucleotide 2'-phosphodiesterase/3'-nucleotidase [Aliiroseovarius sp. Z3]